MDNKVVYIHKKKWGPDAGEVFYVGYGAPSRPRVWKSRSPQWFKIVKEFGYEVEIVAKGLSKSEALTQEALLIDKYSWCKLANKRKGAKFRRSKSTNTYNV